MFSAWNVIASRSAVDVFKQARERTSCSKKMAFQNRRAKLGLIPFPSPSSSFPGFSKKWQKASGHHQRVLKIRVCYGKAFSSFRPVSCQHTSGEKIIVRPCVRPPQLRFEAFVITFNYTGIFECFWVQPGSYGARKVFARWNDLARRVEAGPNLSKSSLNNQELAWMHLSDILWCIVRYGLMSGCSLSIKPSFEKRELDLCWLSQIIR